MIRVNWRASSLHAAIVGVFNSLLQVVAAFGVTISGAQDVAITSCVNSFLVLASLVVIASTNGTNGAAH